MNGLTHPGERVQTGLVSCYFVWLPTGRYSSCFVFFFLVDKINFTQYDSIPLHFAWYPPVALFGCHTITWVWKLVRVVIRFGRRIGRVALIIYEQLSLFSLPRYYPLYQLLVIRRGWWESECVLRVIVRCETLTWRHLGRAAPKGIRRWKNRHSFSPEWKARGDEWLY